MKKFDLKNKKNLLIVIVCIVLLFVLVISLFSITRTQKEKGKEKKSVNLEEKITAVAKKFYEDMYYTYFENKEELGNFADNGINIDLVSLEINVPFDEETTQFLKKKECSDIESKVFIYPSNPFGKTDYKIKVELSCKK